MVDVREDILVRLVAVVATLPGIRSAHRNNIDIPENQLPSVVVLDGDEETNDASDASMRPSHRPTLVQMMPTILIAQQTREVGSIVNMFRRELIKRVLFDTELNEVIVKTGRFGNGGIRYLGCLTDLGQMRSVYGGLLAQFVIKYALKPEDL